ncbi:MAG: hypothetical protein AUJ98_01875 [Bacteroidetes bacterium CG2_30_33_31]|nr:MAG: hypothetical protein AUJ98_01875 [Bacteroidetes bacterium CG2_30_33_31]
MIKGLKFRRFLCDLWIAIALISFYQGNAQFISTDRITDWTKAGLKTEILEPTNLINFIDAGGNNDSLSANDSIISSLIASVGTNGLTIFFPNGKYYFTHSIDLLSNITIKGESADSTIFLFRVAGNSNLINIIGFIDTDTFRFSCSSLKNSHQASLFKTINLQQGNLIKIYDNDSALVSSSWAIHSTGQIQIIDSITNNKVFFDSPLRRDFFLINSPQFSKIHAVHNILLEQITLINLNSTNQQTANIYMDYVYNSKIKCVKSYDCNFAHIDIRNSSNIEVEGSYFQDAFDYGNGGKAYGVVLHQCTGECLISNNNFNHLRHSVLLQAGANGNVISYNYSQNPYWTAVSLPSNSAGDLVLHGNWPYFNLFEGNIIQNIVIDDSHGKNGPFNTFLRNRAELFGIFMNSSPASDSQNFIGNETTKNSFFYGNISLSGVGHFAEGNNQKGTIYPAGTSSQIINSLYLSSAPAYYQHWPVIGLPNQLNAFDNRAKKNFDAASLTQCSETVLYTKEKNNLSSLKVYPNPFSDIINIDNIDNEEILTIQLFDISGKMIYLFGQEKELLLKNLPSGYYFLKVFTNENLYTKKLLRK